MNATTIPPGVRESVEPQLVSIIIACYNAERFLGETLESLVRQTFSDIQILVIDDCSVDNSVGIAAAFAGRDSRIECYSTGENSGPAAARNVGLRKARGRYIAICDADDIWSDNKLERQIQALKATNAAIIGTSVRLINSGGEPIGMRHYASDVTLCYQRFSAFPPHSSLVFDRSRLPWDLYYDVTYQTAEDYKLVLDYSDSCKIISIQNAYVKYRIHETNISRKVFDSLGQVGWAVYARISYELGEQLNDPSTQKIIKDELMTLRIDQRYVRYQNFKKRLRSFQITKFGIEQFVWIFRELVFKQDPRFLFAMEISKKVRGS